MRENGLAPSSKNKDTEVNCDRNDVGVRPKSSDLGRSDPVTVTKACCTPEALVNSEGPASNHVLTKKNFFPHKYGEGTMGRILIRKKGDMGSAGVKNSWNCLLCGAVNIRIQGYCCPHYNFRCGHYQTNDNVAPPIMHPKSPTQSFTSLFDWFILDLSSLN